MKEKFTPKEIETATHVTIIYPTMGTLLMEVKKVVRASDERWYVEGLVWREDGYYQFNMPEEYHGEYEYMNFPITCVRSLVE